VDGWELTRRLKSDPATADIPVIAVTAYGSPGDEARAHKAGFVEFVSKPVSTHTLPDIIRRYVRTR
jgi:CheY-like chemotaxis protein